MKREGDEGGQEWELCLGCSPVMMPGPFPSPPFQSVPFRPEKKTPLPPPQPCCSASLLHGNPKLAPLEENKSPEDIPSWERTGKREQEWKRRTSEKEQKKHIFLPLGPLSIFYFPFLLYSSIILPHSDSCIEGLHTAVSLPISPSLKDPEAERSESHGVGAEGNDIHSPGRPKTPSHSHPLSMHLSISPQYHKTR